MAVIKENQNLLNHLNIISDGLLSFLAIPVAFWLRFYVLPDGVIGIPLRQYLILGFFFSLIQLFVFASFGLYQSFRHVRLLRELGRLCTASLLNLVLMLGWLYLQHGDDYSRQLIAIYYVLSVGCLGAKRIVLRKGLRRFRQHGYNLKHVLIIGGGELATRYLTEIRNDRELGYDPVGYIATEPGDLALPWLGDFDALDKALEENRPDEVISAIEMADYERTPQIIAACEKTGCKLLIIPFYLDYISAKPQFDDLNGIPLLNIRRIPLDNWANAFCKRAMDIVGSAFLLLLFSPIMLACAVGVRLSSPGPIIFRQERVGRNKKPFTMYKFRSMRVNNKQDTGWSSREDSRKTKFGSFIRKYSLDEFPQFWNVLIGDMSLVGPRPEVPYYVDQFKENVPLYMVKHQVRPGITGWAQVNDFRGDTSIQGRIEHDIYYIENWSLLFDIKILWMTVFGGKFKNDEKTG